MGLLSAAGVSGPPADVVEMAPVAADHGASPLSFEAEALVTGPAADATVRAYFPKLAAAEAAARARGEAFDVAVNLGVLSMEHVVLFDGEPLSGCKLEYL